MIDDPVLGQLISREWQASSSEVVQLQDLPSDRVSQTPLNADVIIFPSSLIGQLVTTRQIISWPLPLRDATSNLHSGTSGIHDYRWNDVFPWLRRRELKWGKRVYGVSFGSPQLLLIYRSDLFDQWRLNPPATWRDYASLIAEIRNRIAEQPRGTLRYATLEPTAQSEAAPTLLARAAAYACHPNQYSTLFEFKTMTPLIDQPPFLRALEQLKDAVGHHPVDVRSLNRSEIMDKLLAGETAMAITWPSGARTTKRSVAENATFKIQSLPGSAHVYHLSKQAWQTRDDSTSQAVPLLGIAGRIGAVARRARSVEAASSLLLWLTRSDNSLRISAKSPSTTLFRISQTARPTVWVERELAPVARQFGQAMVVNQQRPQALVVLRIPGQERYMSALDKAVRQAIDAQIAPAEALQGVAAIWSETTTELGQAAQQEAYEASLGLAGS